MSKKTGKTGKKRGPYTKWTEAQDKFLAENKDMDIAKLKRLPMFCNDTTITEKKLIDRIDWLLKTIPYGAEIFPPWPEEYKKTLCSEYNVYTEKFLRSNKEYSIMFNRSEPDVASMKSHIKTGKSTVRTGRSRKKLETIAKPVALTPPIVAESERIEKPKLPNINIYDLKSISNMQDESCRNGALSIINSALNSSTISDLQSLINADKVISKTL